MLLQKNLVTSDYYLVTYYFIYFIIIEVIELCAFFGYMVEEWEFVPVFLPCLSCMFGKTF